ncbi:phosphonate ABC transporter ATP-binding protein [Rhodoblastus sphagnicola]|uniref:Phosphonate ABC transporter ATP-binding protein n=2 Tax=Rhodoblastus sphagnicola TaxID=333368 RepID=A0A2S6N8G4_9HYPH|nr:phosphonate ABC transporter ATP-binding protein [Rhodoblastus sphagnicola]
MLHFVPNPVACWPLPGPATPALSVDGLCVTRGGRQILRQVSTAFAAGVVTVVVGPSGAGKTTLLNVLNGLVEPTGGEVFAHDFGAPHGVDSLRSSDSWAALRQHTATIFQDHALIGRLSALDNVLLAFAESRHPLSPFPWPRFAREAAAKALADVGLLDRAFDRVENFSGGERQRIGIARALARGPRLLLGDEPFSSLDQPLARRLGQDLRALAVRDGVTLVLVLHQIALARALADRIVGLNDGRVVFDGPAEIFDAEAEASVFTSTPNTKGS